MVRKTSFSFLNGCCSNQYICSCDYVGFITYSHYFGMIFIDHLHNTSFLLRWNSKDWDTVKLSTILINLSWFLNEVRVLRLNLCIILRIQQLKIRYRFKTSLITCSNWLIYLLRLQYEEFLIWVGYLKIINWLLFQIISI